MDKMVKTWVGTVCTVLSRKPFGSLKTVFVMICFIGVYVLGSLFISSWNTDKTETEFLRMDQKSPLRKYRDYVEPLINHDQNKPFRNQNESLRKNQKISRYCQLTTFCNYPKPIEITCDHLYNLNISLGEHKHDERKNHKIYVAGHGRLGNVLFQYAAVYGISKLLHRKPEFLRNRKMALIHALFSNLSVPLGSDQLLVPNVTFINETRPNRYNPARRTLIVDIVDSYDEPVQIGTYLHSWKYFLPHAEEDIRREFTFHQHLVDRAISYRNQLLLNLLQANGVVSSAKDVKESIVDAEDMTFVGIHARRGDKANSSTYNVPGEGYYNKAREYFRTNYKNVIFVITGEDSEYLDATFRSDDSIISFGQTAQLDIVLQGLCHHTIMSIGSFSFWAAWLAGGEAIHFKDHIKRGSELWDRFVAEDVYLPHWILMSN